MKYIRLVVCLISISLHGFSQDTIKVWEQFQKQHLRNQEDSTTWSNELLQRDIGDSVSSRKSRPFVIGAFPVPRYDLAGYFRYKGAGSKLGSYSNYQGKKLAYHYYFKNKTEATKDILNGKASETFFIIITLVGGSDTTQDERGGSLMLSRNNPDVVCQGFFSAQNNDEVDYMAFITGNRSEFAVVNMKLFDLKNGRTILVAPQKDHSLRFLQVPTPILANSEVQDFLTNILAQRQVKIFFLNEGNL